MRLYGSGDHRRIVRGTPHFTPRIVALAVAILCAGGFARAQQLTPAWVEVGDAGALARVVVAAPARCPSIIIDGKRAPMIERTPVPKGFQPACQAAIPSGARNVKVNGHALVLPRPNPTRVIAFGDTGCRIKKGTEVQDCNDPDKWPFEQVATRAASEKPALVIHVGDYLYREATCPQGSEVKCADTPSGDNWDAWNADFFSPAAKLLAAAPWAFSRGNHETCARSWRGWFYYLDPRPWIGPSTRKCQDYSPAYLIKLGTFELVMLDSSKVTEDQPDAKQTKTYAAQLASVHATNAWLVDHHPIWGFKEGPPGAPVVPVTPVLQEAWDRASPAHIHLVLSGHVHLFELMSYDRTRPTQLVTGDGGTNLADPIPDSVNGTLVRGNAVVASQTQRQFGYTLLVKSGKAWQLTLKNRLQHVLLSCSILDGPAKCQPPTD